MPNAVIHFLGHKSNFNDVHAGLALQRHCPFEFHFDNIAIINYVSTKAVVKILDNIVRPEVRVRWMYVIPWILVWYDFTFCIMNFNIDIPYPVEEY